MSYVKEYKTLPAIGGLGLFMMVKNERKRLHVSLESVVSPSGVPYVDCAVIYDTGSTDETIDIVKSFCEKHRINLYLKTGEFVNFSVSRNVLLDYADTIPVQFGLLLDTNDELKGGDALKAFLKTQERTEFSRYMICQRWWSGGSYDEYYNVRLIRNNSKLRYEGVVHEYIKDFAVSDDSRAFKVGDGSFHLYQDRTQDDDKTGKRFKRDKELLLTEYKKDPTEPRTLFYLAQTCSCLGEMDEALYYYKLRTKYQGFWEEIFHAYLRIGDIHRTRGNWDDAFIAYIKAGEASDIRPPKQRENKNLDRAEPYHRIAEYYHSKDDWFKAYSFARMACETPIPHHCNLWYDKRIYEYGRWSLLGIVSFYAGFNEIGHLACTQAVKSVHACPFDHNNLKAYTYLLENAKSGSPGSSSSDSSPTQPTDRPTEKQTEKPMTKPEFIKGEMAKMKNIPYSKAMNIANARWVERNNLKGKK